MPAFPSIKPTEQLMPSAEQMPLAPLKPVPQAATATATAPGLGVNAQIKAILADESLSPEQQQQMISRLIQGSVSAPRDVMPPQEGPGSF